MNQRTPTPAQLLQDVAVLTADALRIAPVVADLAVRLMELDRRYNDVVAGPEDLDPDRLERDGHYRLHDAFDRITRPIIAATASVPLPVGTSHGMRR